MPEPSGQEWGIVGKFKVIRVGRFYPIRTAVKLNIGKSSSVTLYGEAAKAVEKVTLYTLMVVKAERTEYSRGTGPVYRDYFSNLEYDNYSKYRCYHGEHGFLYCKKECCEGCTYAPGKKVVNEQYILCENFVHTLDQT